MLCDVCMEKQRSLKATSVPKVGAETETEEQQETEEQETWNKQESEASMCRIHMHEEETRAPLMRVTSEVRLDQATWSSNARTLRVVMREISEM